MSHFTAAPKTFSEKINLFISLIMVLIVQLGIIAFFSYAAYKIIPAALNWLVAL